jgi:hypothetical protein
MAFILRLLAARFCALPWNCFPRLQKMIELYATFPGKRRPLRRRIVERGEKGLLNRLSISFPFTTAAHIAESVRRIRTRAESLYLSWRQLFRPCALGLIGLAIYVVLWSVGYKLSFYNQHAASSSQIPVVKMWLETRHAPITAIFRLRRTSHLIPGSQALYAPNQQCPRLNRSIASVLPVSRRRIPYFYFSIPFRAPPSLRLS